LGDEVLLLDGTLSRVMVKDNETFTQIMNNSVLQIMNDDEKRCEGAAKRRLQTLRSNDKQ